RLRFSLERRAGVRTPRHSPCPRSTKAARVSRSLRLRHALRRVDSTAQPRMYSEQHATRQQIAEQCGCVERKRQRVTLHETGPCVSEAETQPHAKIGEQEKLQARSDRCGPDAKRVLRIPQVPPHPHVDQEAEIDKGCGPAIAA